MKRKNEDVVLGPAVISQSPQMCIAAVVGAAALMPGDIPFILSPALSPFGLGPDVNLRFVSGACLLLSAGLFIRIAITLFFNEYRITESKVIQRWGLIPHYRTIKLKDIRITTTVRIPLISLGSVRITTSGNGEDDIVLASLRHPRKVKALIDETEKQWWRRQENSVD